MVTQHSRCSWRWIWDSSSPSFMTQFVFFPLSASGTSDGLRYVHVRVGHMGHACYNWLTPIITRHRTTKIWLWIWNEPLCIHCRATNLILWKLCQSTESVQKHFFLTVCYIRSTNWAQGIAWSVFRSGSWESWERGQFYFTQIPEPVSSAYWEQIAINQLLLPSMYHNSKDSTPMCKVLSLNGVLA